MNNLKNQNLSEANEINFENNIKYDEDTMELFLKKEEFLDIYKYVTLNYFRNLLNLDFYQNLS